MTAQSACGMQGQGGSCGRSRDILVGRSQWHGRLTGASSPQDQLTTQSTSGTRQMDGCCGRLKGIQVGYGQSRGRLTGASSPPLALTALSASGASLSELSQIAFMGGAAAFVRSRRIEHRAPDLL
jgi:hypothetical protein